MIDIDASHIELWQMCAIFGLYWLLILLAWKNTMSYNAIPGICNINGSKSAYLYWGLFIISLFAFFDGDYYHYWLTLNSSNIRSITRLENVYQQYIALAGHNYLLFRIVIWGAATICFYLSVKNLKLNKTLAVFILMALYLGLFTYARATLAMSVLFLGCSYLFQARLKDVNIFIVGVALICLSTLFHRSIIIAIFCVILGYFFKFTKRRIILFVVLFPLLIVLARTIFNSVLSGILISDEVSIKRIESYSQSESTTANVKGIIQKCISLTAFYLPVVILIINAYFKRGYNRMSRVMQRLLNSSLIIILLALAFQFMGPESRILAYRIRYMAFIPIVMCLCYMTQHRLIAFAQYRACIWIGLISFAYRNLFVIYQFFK